MNKKFVLFGNINSIYTKMVIYYLDLYSVEFDFINIENKGVVSNSSFFKKIKSLSKSGAFKGVSKVSPFFIWLLIERYMAKKNKNINEILFRYENVIKTPELTVASINSEEALVYLKNHAYDYALFGGVGIVSDKTINTVKGFCLNAHPAPLPDCRGGGALECTLVKGLEPAVSVHIATAGIDEGEIIKVKKLNLSDTKDYSFLNISTLLTELCAKELALIAKSLNDDLDVPTYPNNGKLNYWKDWSSRLQILARVNLFKLKLKNKKAQ